MLLAAPEACYDEFALRSIEVEQMPWRQKPSSPPSEMLVTFTDYQPLQGAFTNKQLKNFIIHRTKRDGNRAPEPAISPSTPITAATHTVTPMENILVRKALAYAASIRPDIIKSPSQCDDICDRLTDFASKHSALISNDDIRDSLVHTIVPTPQQAVVKQERASTFRQAIRTILPKNITTSPPHDEEVNRTTTGHFPIEDILGEPGGTINLGKGAPRTRMSLNGSFTTTWDPEYTPPDLFDVDAKKLLPSELLSILPGRALMREINTIDPLLQNMKNLPAIELVHGHSGKITMGGKLLISGTTQTRTSKASNEEVILVNPTTTDQFPIRPLAVSIAEKIREIATKEHDFHLSTQEPSRRPSTRGNKSARSVSSAYTHSPDRSAGYTAEFVDVHKTLDDSLMPELSNLRCILTRSTQDAYWHPLTSPNRIKASCQGEYKRHDQHYICFGSENEEFAIHRGSNVVQDLDLTNIQKNGARLTANETFSSGLSGLNEGVIDSVQIEPLEKNRELLDKQPTSLPVLGDPSRSGDGATPDLSSPPPRGRRKVAPHLSPPARR